MLRRNSWKGTRSSRICEVFQVLFEKYFFLVSSKMEILNVYNAIFDLAAEKLWLTRELGGRFI